jgi:hypothetical protein
MDFLTEQIDEFLAQSTTQDMLSISNLEQKVEKICSNPSVTNSSLPVKKQDFELFNNNINHLKFGFNRVARKISDESTTYSETSSSSSSTLP